MAASLQLANGTTMTLGQVTFPLTINNQTKTITAQTLVDPPFELLLGLNIGEVFNITCDLRKRTASVHFTNEQLQAVNPIPLQFQQLITAIKTCSLKKLLLLTLEGPQSNSIELKQKTIHRFHYVHIANTFPP